MFGEFARASGHAGLTALVDPPGALGERVAWAGRPDWEHWAGSWWPPQLVGWLWIAFVAAWSIFATCVVILGDARRPLDFLFPLWGLPLAAPGVWLLRWPARVRRRWARTWYVITDHRAIVIRPGLLGLSIASYDASFIPRVKCTVDYHGYGDVVLDSHEYPDGWTYEGFFNIRDARRVGQLLRESVQGQSGAPG